MSDEETPGNQDLPADEHLREDIAPGSGEEQAASPDGHFLPGQTNAGQQVGGLASATGYGDGQDPDKRDDSNNPI
ncbi:hypothetical protein DXK94_13950 [Arthrobacter sp. RT-1]|uniref:hypothetical protein n=1 Tax=Arthrobacter sp. RT-1 TaxID=2292263 RepID=UPI000E1F25B1|nr:hypothetical protein [Arthrobacter sp. RT-1]RDV09478.1 hypothetical protein DXK94_13950 [Arthrobacter sp. RT-1]